MSREVWTVKLSIEVAVEKEDYPTQEKAIEAARAAMAAARVSYMYYAAGNIDVIEVRDERL